MKTIHSLHSLTETTISLQTIAYCLNTCRPLLNDYEKELATEFVIMLVASMVKSPADPITIWPSSITQDAITELHVQNELYAVLDVLNSAKYGDMAKSYSEPSKKTQPNISPDTSQKNTPTLRIIETDKNPSHE